MIGDGRGLFAFRRLFEFVEKTGRDEDAGEGVAEGLFVGNFLVAEILVERAELMLFVG